MQEQLIGSRIATARMAKGLSERQLANRLGVEASSVESWESGLREPRANRINQLAGILEVPLTWLVAGGEALPEVDGPHVNETQGIELKLERAEQLVNELSFLVAELRAQTRRVQRDIDYA